MRGRLCAAGLFLVQGAQAGKVSCAGQCCGRRDILVQRARRLGRTPTGREAPHPDDAHRIARDEGKNIARAKCAMRLVDARAIDADGARGAGALGGRARPEETRVPKPFVETLPVSAQV